MLSTGGVNGTGIVVLDRGKRGECPRSERFEHRSK